MAKKITMHQKTATGYDVLHPDTHIAQVKCPADVASEVGAETGDGQAIMQSISATDKTISGYGTTTGTSKAFVLALEGKPDMAIVDGMMIRVKFHLASDEEPTIDVNGSGAKNIYSLNQSKLLFTIAKNVWVVLMYSASLDGWIVQGWAKKKIFHTEVITKTTRWTVPEIAGDISVRLFGGGSGGQNGRYGGIMLWFDYSGAGGGGGHMAYDQVSPKIGETIQITIGTGGVAPDSTQSQWGGAGGTTSFGSYLSANGGSGVDGGSGGGAGEESSKAGNGSYGGGGGGATYSDFSRRGGNGGTYGGGGYGLTGGTGRNGRYTSSYTYGAGYAEDATSSKGGNGQNTIGMGLDFEGEGEGVYGGGGGYGGNGGSYGGGGGYGGNGGKGDNRHSGGGGGGYGGNGGDGVEGYGGGGGGGYGVNGNGGSGTTKAGYAAGGVGGYGNNIYAGTGGSGVCVLSYWSWDVDY